MVKPSASAGGRSSLGLSQSVYLSSRPSTAFNSTRATIRDFWVEGVVEMAEAQRFWLVPRSQRRHNCSPAAEGMPRTTISSMPVPESGGWSVLSAALSERLKNRKELPVVCCPTKEIQSTFPEGCWVGRRSTGAMLLIVAVSSLVSTWA